jgi:FixJ family two-component response regulator
LTNGQIVHVVDDDETVRDSLRFLLESLRLAVRTHASAREFLSAYDAGQSGCLVLDVRMPEISGLQLQEELAQRGIRIPIVMVTGHGDVPMAVRAMKSGAFDFLPKPFNGQGLIECVQRALAADVSYRQEDSQRRVAAEQLRLLTSREREVLNQLLAGRSNKLIARQLAISVKTVEVHRRNVKEKMAVHSVAELSALCHRAGVPTGIP